MISPESNFMDDTVELGQDVVLEPGVILKGKTVIGEGSRVGAYSYLTDFNAPPQTTIAPHTVKQQA
jgi:bifunctional UDP-N-acetylglucosamine pyrophosphorylase / glucosamine-1-phosphate N-acetyltransferase